jgi:hypothetical protein
MKKKTFVYLAVGVCAAVACASFIVIAAGTTPAPTSDSAKIAALEAKVDALERRLPPPELGHQMLDLQIRHDRLWWAGKAGNWNLAYYMVGELGEALHGIEETNGEAPEVQPENLSEVMPAIMNPAIQTVQAALEKRDKVAFARAYDHLSASCNACHALAGVGFLHIQRPKTPLLDNLRYAPKKSGK